MLSKQQIIDRIRLVNQSAAIEWLARFSDAALRRYLDHLQLTLEPRGRSRPWVRTGETPALLVHAPQD